MVTTNQITKGLVRFIKNDMASATAGDAGARSLMSILAAAVDVKPEIITNFLQNEMLRSFWSDGMFDLDAAMKIMVAAAKDGGFMISLPSIPLLSSNEKQFSFSADDFRRLSQYITEA